MPQFLHRTAAATLGEAQTILRTPEVLVRVMPLAVGESTPVHYHTEITDTIVCLSGGIRIALPDDGASGRVVELTPGERITISPKTRHAVANTATARSEYLLVQGVGKYDFVSA